MEEKHICPICQKEVFPFGGEKQFSSSKRTLVYSGSDSDLQNDYDEMQGHSPRCQNRQQRNRNPRVLGGSQCPRCQRYLHYKCWMSGKVGRGDTTNCGCLTTT